jgi:hypothetical protein
VHPSHALARISLRSADGRLPSTTQREGTHEIHADVSIKPGAKRRDEAIARFKKTGGQPPKAPS